MRTSVVRNDGYVVWYDGTTPNPPEGPYPERQYENGPGVGRHSMRLRFPGDAENTSPFAEQRFAIGSTNPEIWIRYWLRVPINYVHRTTGSQNGAYNNKWFAIWTDQYSGQSAGGITVIWNTAPWGSGGSSVDVNYTVRGVDSPHVSSVGNWISTTDRGRWMQVVHYVKLATGAGANNGIYRMWRRWEDESSWTQIHNVTDRDFWPSSGPYGFTAGYVLGWANSGYANQTEFLVDDFQVSTTSLLSVAPRPPADVRAD